MSNLKNEKMQALNGDDLNNISGGIINKSKDRVSINEPSSFSAGPRVNFKAGNEAAKKRFDNFIKNRDKGT